jgi:hypothetical protein
MRKFVKGNGTGPLMLGDRVGPHVAIRSNATTRSSMLNDDEVLTLARSCSHEILRFGSAHVDSVLSLE